MNRDRGPEFLATLFLGLFEGAVRRCPAGRIFTKLKGAAVGVGPASTAGVEGSMTYPRASMGTSPASAS